MEKEVKLYPNCESTVWLRSCEEEIIQPIKGTTTGEIPRWLRGTLIRNGPGSLKVGSMRFKHLFDSAALLHRFAIQDGEVTYQCRFLQSNTYKRNQTAQRIVVTEFGTAATPDPCHTIFDRFASIFKPGESLTDNAMISVYPFGDEIYAFTEGPVIHRIDPTTLDTLDRRNLTECIAILNHTSHPHVMQNGDVYNVGMSVISGRIKHVVVKFPYLHKGDMFANAEVVGSIKPRWSFHPAYMHTFGITENYYIIVEQPLTVSLMQMARNQLLNQPLVASLKWFQDYETHIILINRKTGFEEKRYTTETLFYLHIINCYESDLKLVVDLCAYKDAKIIDAMYVHAIETMQTNPDYAQCFRGRPKRLEIDLREPNLTKIQSRILADIGCETPRLHYDKFNGRPYRYFYAIGSEVDVEHTGSLIKVDTKSGEILKWWDDNSYPSEPIFVPKPEAKDEDDGVIISAVVCSNDERRVSLLILNAKDLTELARTTFTTPSPAPKCLHGWFIPTKE
ncbi:carotenoid isomerooxygenase-like [Pieris rapae]|uniref:carotenoid isomerooxygenase-like n=1 Tax=Pieris rapae TaxID=64459 RepID=UPI001E27E205|nr:carotenoid isomerooxygenase-like [Pieris rapae]